MTKRERIKRIEEKKRQLSEDPEKVEQLNNRDFRWEITGFKDDFEPIDKYFIYKALGIRTNNEWYDYAKTCKQKGICEDPQKYEGNLEADNCSLIQAVYWYLWDKKHLTYCTADGKSLTDEAPLTGDTMNSCTTILNYLIEKKLIDRKDNNGCVKLCSNICEALQDLRQNWSIAKAISQYCQDLHLDSEENITLKEALEKHRDDKNTLRKELEMFTGLVAFLDVAYTIGNFTPVPYGCNDKRGKGLTQDSWPLALKCIYDWYETSQEDKKKSFLAKLLNYNQDAMNNYSAWLKSFETWDNFVDKNFLQDYTEWQKRPYGRPKEFWDGQFDGAPLPVTTEQFQAFFTHATACIKARSERMVKALKCKLENLDLTPKEAT